MTKHQMVTMRLHRSGVVLAAVLALLFAILVFVAGCLAGMRRAGRAVPAAPLPMVPIAGAASPPPAAGTAPAAQSAPAPAVTIRAGVFTEEADAKSLAAKLAAGKIETSIVSTETGDGTPLHMVITGHYAKREEAVAAAERLESKYGLIVTIIPAPEP